MSLKFAVYSDFHFELTRFPWTPILSDDVDVLVVAGDVYQGDIARGIAWTAETARGRPSVFVPGNHEFWGRTIEDDLDRGREVAASRGVTMLDGEGWIDVAGCLFCGGTLWTDLTLNVPAGQRIYGRHLGEHVDVRGAGIDRRAKPADAIRWHCRIRDAIAQALAEPRDGRPRVVVTHHAPTARSLREAHRKDPGAAFAASALDHLLAPGPDVWVHGHVHHSVDLVCDGGARLVCNPFGYHGVNPDFDASKVVEVVADGREAESGGYVRA